MSVFVGEFGSTPNPGIIGYMEVDGVPGASAGDTPVYIGDKVEEGVLIYVNCNNWLVTLVRFNETHFNVTHVMF